MKIIGLYWRLKIKKIILTFTLLAALGNLLFSADKAVLEKDYENAKKYFMQAENILKESKNEQSVDKAIMLFKKSASLGAAPAYNQLGIIYITGSVVKEDAKIAHQYFYKAATIGFFMAYTNLATLYLTDFGDNIGLDVDTNDRIGNMWFVLLEETFPDGYQQSKRYQKLKKFYEMNKKEIKEAKKDAKIFKNGLFVVPNELVEYVKEPDL